MSAALAGVIAPLAEGSSGEDFWSIFGVIVLLVLVGSGLAVLLPNSWAHSVHEKLTSGSTTGLPDRGRSLLGVISAFYWPLVVVIFLGWGFIGNGWGKSWIVWPIAAVLFGAIAAGLGALQRHLQTPRA